MLDSITADTAAMIVEVMGAVLAVLGSLVVFAAVLWGNKKLLQLFGREYWD